MRQAYIVDALRTPTGRRKGGLAHVHAADLGGFVLKTLVERNAIPADEYDDVVFGCTGAGVGVTGGPDLLVPDGDAGGVHPVLEPPEPARS